MRISLSEYVEALSRHLRKRGVPLGLWRALPVLHPLTSPFPNKLKNLLASQDLRLRALRMLARLPQDLRSHSSRVADLSVRTAQRMNLDDATIKRIYLAGIFHDIGKAWIKKDILTKPASLTPDEYEHMKQHASLGAHWVHIHLALPDVARIILHHHERMDGRGYPANLLGEEIPLESRVIAVADAYDAMIGGPGGSSRQYRPRRTKEEALNELMVSAGTQFDSQVVKTFCALLQERRPLFRKTPIGRLAKKEAPD